MIAMALACDPKLLIADEPTTALDVTIQAQILDLMRELKEKTGAAIVLITHDLGVVAEMAQRVVVMYAGRKVEEAPVDDAVRAAAPSLHARAAQLDPAAGRAASAGASGSPRFPAWCRRCARRSPAASSRRAAPTRPSAAGASIRRSSRRRRAHWSPAGKSDRIAGAWRAHERQRRQARCSRCATSPSTTRCARACSRA